MEDKTVLIDTTLHLAEVKEKKSPLKLIVVLAMIAVSLGCIPFLLSKTDTDRDRQKKREELAAMTQAERDKLKHDYEKFKKLPANTQEAYRKLHRTLEADRKQGGELNQVMRDYESWLQSLSLKEWDELHKEGDATERVQAVAAIQSDRAEERRKLKEETDRVLSRLSGFGGMRFRSGGDKALAEVVGILENNLSAEAVPSEEITGIARYVEVIKRSIERTPDGQSWPVEPVMEKITALYSMRYIKRVPESARRSAIARTVIFTLFGMMYREAAPNREELESYLSTLPDKERRALLRDPRKLMESARREFMKRKGTQFKKKTENIRKLVALMESTIPGFKMPRPGERPKRPGFGGPGGRDRGRGGPGGRERETDRKGRGGFGPSRSKDKSD